MPAAERWTCPTLNLPHLSTLFDRLILQRATREFIPVDLDSGDEDEEPEAQPTEVDWQPEFVLQLASRLTDSIPNLAEKNDAGQAARRAHPLPQAPRARAHCERHFHV